MEQKLLQHKMQEKKETNTIKEYCLLQHHNKD